MPGRNAKRAPAAGTLRRKPGRQPAPVTLAQLEQELRQWPQGCRLVARGADGKLQAVRHIVCTYSVGEGRQHLLVELCT